MYLSRKTKILRNFIYSLHGYIYYYYINKPVKKNERKLIFLHFLKSQEIIIIYFFILSLLTNFISLIFFRKKLLSLKNSQKNKIFNIFSKIKPIKFQKTIELVHALIILSNNYNEKVKKLSINNFTPNKNNLFFDNIVVGSGPSGSVTALSLKEKKLESLILEAGESFSIPMQKHSGFEFLKKWLFGGLSGAIGNIDIQYASAKCFGGGSEINSGLYHEIDKEFIDKTYGGKTNYDKIKKFEPTEIVEYQNDHSTELINLKNIYIRGSEKLNWKIEHLKRFKKNKTNVKNSMSNTYLEKYKNLGGSLLTNAKVQRIFEKDKLLNVEVLYQKKSIVFKCNNVFLCCGAPYSLDLLKKSDIINKSHNSNFHFHPMFKIIAKYNSKVNSDKSIDIIETQVTEFFPEFIFGNAASGKQFLKIATFNNSRAYQDVEKNFKNMTIFHATFSVGRSNFKNIPFLKQPIISYQFSKQEILLIKKGIKNLVKFIFKSGAEYIYLGDKNVTRIDKYDEIQLDKIIKEKNISLSSVHLLGGLNMLDEKVFDKKQLGKIKNSKFNIYVNDSTLLNQKLLKNPQGAVMTISKNNISKFLENYD
tara:strand:- start:2370 stop:4139 length:1770 start_codon:yes stop_codon:yes gene_type:complete